MPTSTATQPYHDSAELGQPIIPQPLGAVVEPHEDDPVDRRWKWLRRSRSTIISWVVILVIILAIVVGLVGGLVSTR